MTRALVVHLSKMGKTRAFADRLGEHLTHRGIETTVTSVYAFRPEMMNGVDLLLLGAWTHGLLVVCQHPDAEWVEFVRSLPPLGACKVGLFTTYLIATGSMFWRMKRHLAGKTGKITLTLKSRTEELSPANARQLDRFAGM